MPNPTSNTDSDALASYRTIDPDTYYDEAAAKLAKKTATIQARPAIAGEVIVTRMGNGLEETRNTANAGDFVVRNPGGEQYIVGGEQFAKKYVAAAMPGTYKPSGGPVKVMPLTEDVRFTASWGEEMKIKAGGVLVKAGPGDIYGIQPKEFATTYSFLDDISPSHRLRGEFTGATAGVALGLYGLIMRSKRTRMDLEAGPMQGGASIIATIADATDVVLGGAGILDDIGVGISGASQAAYRLAIPLAVLATSAEAAAGIAAKDYKRSAKSGASFGAALTGGKLGAGACSFAGPWGAMGCGIAGGLVGGFLGEEVVEQAFNLPRYHNKAMQERWQQGGLAAVDLLIRQTPMGEEEIRMLNPQTLGAVAKAKLELYHLLVNAPDVPDESFQQTVAEAEITLLQTAIDIIEPSIIDTHGDSTLYATQQKLSQAHEVVAMITKRSPKEVKKQAESIIAVLHSYREGIGAPHPATPEIDILEKVPLEALMSNVLGTMHDVNPVDEAAPISYVAYQAAGYDGSALRIA